MSPERPEDRPASGYDIYPFIAEFYDTIIPYASRPDVGFFLDYAKMTGGPVLELGCGTGRVLLPTAAAGIEIVGLDNSRYMLDVCKARIAVQPPEVRGRITLHHSDMRHFNLDWSFALITIPFRSFQHLISTDDQLSCLTSCRRHLDRGGLFILDIFDPFLPFLIDENRKQEFGSDDEFELADGRRVVVKQRDLEVHHTEQYLDSEMIFYVTHPDGRQERLVHQFKMRYLFRYEVEHLMARTGFEIEDIFGNYDRQPFGTRRPQELIVVARAV